MFNIISRFLKNYLAQLHVLSICWDFLIPWLILKVISDGK